MHPWLNCVLRGHERNGRAPGTVLRGTAHRADAHRIDCPRREVSDDDALGVREYPHVLPRPRAGAILHMIRLGAGHGLQIHLQLGGERVVQAGHHRRYEGYRAVAPDHHVEARSQHLRFGEAQALNIGGDLAQGRDQRISRLILRGGVLWPAHRRRAHGILIGHLQRRKVGDGYGEVGEQRIGFQAHNRQDCEAVQLIFGQGRK